MPTFEPLTAPQFGPAARALVRTLHKQPTLDERAATLLDLSRRLGDAWFPFYLKLLMVVGEGAPDSARAMLAEAVAHGMQRGQTAAGTLSSWGMPVAPSAALAVAGRGFLRMASARPLDPLAYLTVWFGQSTARRPLPQAAFERAVMAVLRLFAASPAATAVYQAKLEADLLAAADGTFSATTLQRLRELLAGWRRGTPAAALAQAVASAGLAVNTLPQVQRFV